MAPTFPQIPMDKVQEMDLQVTYWMLFKHMLEDFVHKDDLQAILKGNRVTTQLTGEAPPPGYYVIGTGLGKADFPFKTDQAARATNLQYQTRIETGFAVRETITKGIEKATGS
jgi:hypothetical protein